MWRAVWESLHERLLEDRHRLPLWLAPGLAAGALIWFQPRSEPPLWPALIVLAVSLPVLVRGWGQLAPRLAGCALLSLSLGYSAAWTEGHRASPFPELPRHAVILEGKVVSSEQLPSRPGEETGSRRVTFSDARFDYWLTDTMAPLRRTIRVRLRNDDSLVFGPGDRLRVRVLLSPPPFPALPGGRDLQREAWFSGGAGTGRALGLAVLAGSENAEPHREGVTERLRERIAARISAVLPGTEGAIASTLLVGMSGAIPERDRDAFAASGLSHLLAVAGLHLGIVTGLIIAVIRYGLVIVPWTALRWPCREIAAVAGLAGGGVYVVMTGLHLPAVRSFIMAALFVLALLTGRRAASMRGLAVAACLMLLTGPSVMLGVPFQMSFAAVMALIAGYEVLRLPLMRLHGDGSVSRRVFVHLCTLALTSLLAGCATLPVSMAHFGEIQPFFVVANMVAVPLTALWVMPAGLLALMLMPFHLSTLALVPMGWGIEAIIWSAREVAAWPAARIPVPMMPGVGLATFFAGLCWLCLWTTRWRLAGILPVLAGFFSPFFLTLPDMVIAPDGGVVAVRADRELLMTGRSRDAWSEREALTQAFALPVGDIPVSGGESHDGALVCGEDGVPGVCMLSRNGHAVLIRAEDHSDGETLIPDALCQGMDLFVSVSPARRSCNQVPTTDRFSVWREGAVAVWMTSAGVRTVSDREWAGKRMWVMRPGGHGVPVLPMAQEE